MGAVEVVSVRNVAMPVAGANGIFLSIGSEAVQRAANERRTDKRIDTRITNGDWTDSRGRSTRRIDLIQGIGATDYNLPQLPL